MKDVEFSYNSSLKRLRIFLNGKLVKELTGKAAKVEFKRISKK